MPWPVGPDGDGRLPGQDPGPGLEAGSQRTHAVDQVERRPHRPLGVVLLRGRSAPHGHDRVADELLDRPPVALDGLPGEVEVAGEEIARLLGVAALGEGGETDEVDEEDRDEAALGDRSHWSLPRRAGGLPNRAIEARGAFPQYFAVSAFGIPHSEHAIDGESAHSAQNFRPTSFSAPQPGHTTAVALQHRPAQPPPSAGRHDRPEHRATSTPGKEEPSVTMVFGARGGAADTRRGAWGRGRVRPA